MATFLRVFLLNCSPSKMPHIENQPGIDFHVENEHALGNHFGCVTLSQQQGLS